MQFLNYEMPSDKVSKKDNLIGKPHILSSRIQGQFLAETKKHCHSLNPGTHAAHVFYSLNSSTVQRVSLAHLRRLCGTYARMNVLIR